MKSDRQRFLVSIAVGSVAGALFGCFGMNFADRPVRKLYRLIIPPPSVPPVASRPILTDGARGEALLSYYTELVQWNEAVISTQLAQGSKAAQHAIHEQTFVAGAWLACACALSAGATLIVLSLLGRHFAVAIDGFTRCGACGHILRGITEPRCPECGRRL
jgi:hypothetical protein